MAILDFQKPDKVIMISSDDKSGIFEFRPLEPGYGITIGNALRRILLSSLEGFAITSVKIEGIDHEFSTIRGVIEDVTEICLNLKQVVFKRQIEDTDNERLMVKVTGQKQFKAGDIGNYTSAFQVLNPDLVICNMDESIVLQMEIQIGKGRGYVFAEDNKSASAPLGEIALDATYTPIRKVNSKIENFRVEQKTDYEKLIMEVDTNGSITPKDALSEAAKILIHHFMLFSDEKISLETQDKSSEEEFDETSLHMRQLLKTKLNDLDLSVRALNCLKAAEVYTLGELVTYQRNDLLKFRNFGKKSLTELDELVEKKGLAFGMNVSKYKLDKD
ncbi:MAG TPA: DNA-directed RNA polymerase subunit alpha [Flavobacteriales bacterium]|jgi:DNA-directed RNA polymerase subunit alpha|nr:DNA-directed RNA polymerase subunit alpha [Flavobacteriales bacterium]